MKRILFWSAVVAALVIAAGHPKVKQAFQQRFGTRKSGMNQVTARMRQQLDALVKAWPAGDGA